MKIFNSISEFFSRVHREARARIAQREMMARLRSIGSVHSALNKFRYSGLLDIDEGRGEVMIAQTLAEQFIYDEQSWQKFMAHLNQWAVYEISFSRYRYRLTQAQAQAEATAYKDNPEIDPAQRRKVRMESRARFEAMESDKEAMRSDRGSDESKIPLITFYIVGSDSTKPIAKAELQNGRYEITEISDDAEA